MDNLSPLQVVLLVMMVVWTISAVVVSAGIVILIVRMSSILDVVKVVMRVSTATNIDTRTKAEKVEKVAAEIREVATKTTEEVTNKVTEIKKAVTPEPTWKPGQPDPRGANLGPEARGRGPTGAGWLIGPALVAFGLMSHAAAMGLAEQPQHQEVVVSNPNGELVAAAQFMAGRDYLAAYAGYTNALKNGCDEEVCHARRAECLYYLGNVKEVMAEADVLEQKHPTSPWPSYLRGLVAKRDGCVRVAREHFHRAAILGHPQAAGQLRATRAG